MRLIVEVTKAVRAALPERMFVGVRLSASEWTAGGFEIDEAVEVASALKEAGAVYICASSGGNVHDAHIPLKPLYQAHLAEAIQSRAGISTRAVGLITRPAEAEAIVAEGRADMVALARAILADPRWPWRAAAELGARLPVALPYERSLPTMRHWVSPAG
jgi:2,4-dienoyl-CoA reductase-like NADH-dependent reductase (Old Yellow Enzyme family)